MYDVLMLGSSGQSRETLQLMRVLGLCGPDSRVAFADETSEAALLDEVRSGAAVGAVALGIGHPEARLRVWRTWHEVVTAGWPALVHPAAVIGDTTRVGEGAMVAAGVVTTCDVELGPACLLNTNVAVGHDVVVGEAAVVNPGATLGGGAVIGAGALVGSGANVREGRRVGAGAVVGSGAVVTKDVADGEVVVGVPARVMSR